MTSRLFVDTSALAKWYLNEEQSERFASFMAKTGGATISRLVVVEMHSLLNRRLRARDFSNRVRLDILRAFETDLRQGFVEVHPLEDRHVEGAADILRDLPGIPVRTLDALHLAAALALGAPGIATADRVMARAGRKLGLRVVTFY